MKRLSLLTVLALSCVRHPLAGSWHEIKWHKQRPDGILYGAKRPYKGSPIVADLELGYANFCIKQLAYDLKPHSKYLFEKISKVGPDLATELTRALRETGTAFLIAEDDAHNPYRLDIATDTNSHYDLTCESNFQTVFCRFKDRFCGSPGALKDRNLER